MYLDQAKAFVQKENPQLEAQFKGCSEEEIQALEETMGCRFPAAFKEFLAWFGNGGGGIMTGSHFYADCISGAYFVNKYGWEKRETMTEGAVELLDECGLDGAELLEYALVIMEHQGYMFEFIPLDEGENPPVYRFVEHKLENDPPFELAARSFSNYIEDLVESQGMPPGS